MGWGCWGIERPSNQFGSRMSMKFLLISKKTIHIGICYKSPVISYFAETINFSPKDFDYNEQKLTMSADVGPRFIAAGSESV